MLHGTWKHKWGNQPVLWGILQSFTSNMHLDLPIWLQPGHMCSKCTLAYFIDCLCYSMPSNAIVWQVTLHRTNAAGRQVGNSFMPITSPLQELSNWHWTCWYSDLCISDQIGHYVLQLGRSGRLLFITYIEQIFLAISAPSRKNIPSFYSFLFLSSRVQ
jgi:hypothetical protein